MRIKQKQKEISERDKSILEMRKQEKSIIEIGKFFNLKKQRIWQILEKNGDPLDKGIDL